MIFVIVKIAFTVIVVIMIAYFAFGSIYLWRMNNKPFSEYTMLLLCSLLLGGLWIYGWHWEQQIVEAKSLTNIVLEKSAEYSNTKNVDLSGKTICETYTLLISEGFMENNANPTVVREMCVFNGCQRTIAKNRDSNAYEVVPKPE